MAIEVKVPQLPESVTDATLVSWHKAPGDAVRRDENLVDLETDKVVLEVPAPENGTLKDIKIDNGATVTAGQILALLEPGDAPAEKPSTAEKAPAAAAAVKSVPAASNDDEPGPNAGKLSPSVRRLLEEHDLDADEISGSGRGGRILKGDVQDYLEHRGGGQLEPESEDVVADAAMRGDGDDDGGGARREHRVAMTRLRTRIAERMVEAQQTAAMLTTFNEIDLTQVIELRKRYREDFEKKHGVKLGFMSFFIKASIEALHRFPVVNASVEGNEIVYHDYFDVGIAVSSERGLIVPVIRDADRMSFAEIEKTINDYGVKAREGGITMEELTGGTFTITNGGIFGSMLSTPILNPPQSGILGMHNIQQRPVVVDGQIVPRPIMYVALTYDHRIIDGREAVQFLVAIKEVLEDPGRLLLQV